MEQHNLTNRRQALSEAVAAYVARFGAGPPTFGMEEKAAERAIRRALAVGKPIATGAESDIPDGAVL